MKVLDLALQLAIPGGLGRRGGGARPFRPRDLSGMFGMWDAEHVNTTGSLVDRLLDASPNAEAGGSAGLGWYLDASGAARATLIASDPTFAGKAVLSFSGAQWYRRVQDASTRPDDALLVPLPVRTAMTWVVIASVTTITGASDRGFVAFTATRAISGGAYSAPYFFARIRPAGFLQCYLEGMRDTNLTPAAATPHCWIYTYDGDVSQGGTGAFRAYRDGVEMTPTPQTAATFLTRAEQVLTIGTTDPATTPASRFHIGRFGAAFGYSRLLPADERAAIASWSHNYYGTAAPP
jgi:hypothetical protein